MSKQKRLGRGLDALLASRHRHDENKAGAAVTEAPIDELVPGRYQPRRHVDDEGLAELAASIREQGVLQPLVVRAAGPAAEVPAAKLEIVAGERRWRAAKLAGLAAVPVVVRKLDDQSALAVALIENLQREDLSPIDQAQSLSRLASEFKLTHEQVAKAVGRSRASVSNLLRLLDLHDDVKNLLADGAIDMGHARALLPLDSKRQVAMARKSGKEGWSVRQVEKAVRHVLDAPAPGTRANPAIDLQTRWLQQQISGELGRELTIRPDKDGHYNLRIGFKDLEQLQDALQRIQELIAQLRDAAGPRARSAPHARDK